MFSKLIPNSSIIRKGNDKEMVLYALEAHDNQIILSKDGVLYLRSDRSGVIIDNSKLEGTKKKEGSLFNKSNSCIELLFEFDKTYICYSGVGFYLFCFTHTQDNATVYTQMEINDFLSFESSKDIMDYADLTEFLYEIDNSYGRDSAGYESFANENPITGKFIFSDGIDYARYYNSEVIFKNPLSEFNKNQIDNIIAEAGQPKKYAFKVENISSSEEDEDSNSGQTHSFAEKILKTVQEESDFEKEMYNEEIDDEIRVRATNVMNNYLIITRFNSVEIYGFYVFYIGEDKFEVESQRLDLESFSDVRWIFSNFLLK